VPQALGFAVVSPSLVQNPFAPHRSGFDSQSTGELTTQSQSNGLFDEYGALQTQFAPPF
jgi:hypothetical protein